MDIYTAVGRTENHPVYSRLATSNLRRQYDFLRSVTRAAIDSGHNQVTEALIRSLNHHAIAGLHAKAGLYRDYPSGTQDQHGNWTYRAPPAGEVPDLMSEFVEKVNKGWTGPDPLRLASYCVWRVNFIHPFVNGNGRTARALCYFVLSVGMGAPLPGEILLPELIKRRRDEYVAALREVDAADKEGRVEEGLLTLIDFVGDRLTEQMT